MGLAHTSPGTHTVEQQSCSAYLKGRTPVLNLTKRYSLYLAMPVAAVLLGFTIGVTATGLVEPPATLEFGTFGRRLARRTGAGDMRLGCQDCEAEREVALGDAHNVDGDPVRSAAPQVDVRVGLQ